MEVYSANTEMFMSGWNTLYNTPHICLELSANPFWASVYMRSLHLLNDQCLHLILSDSGCFPHAVPSWFA
jgi:hypothetical protein